MGRGFALVTGTLCGIIALGAFAFLYAQELRSDSKSVEVLGKEDARVIYSLEEQGENQKLMSFKFGLAGDQELSANRESGSQQKVFLSPDRKYLAVTFQPNEQQALTYIADLNGEVLASPKPGSFRSWTPDSTKVLLYLSIEATGEDRQIYYLDILGNYYDSGLPHGVTGADVSADGRVSYSLTDSRTDDTDLYIRDSGGTDRLILEGGGKILAWARWSPDGKKIAYMRSDLQGSTNQEIWIMSSDGSAQAKVSNVQWNYPPVWSPDGGRIAFSYDGDIWEYSVLSGELNNTTDEGEGQLPQHPSYSADGQTIVFSGVEQIWAMRNGVMYQITGDRGKHAYPVLP